MVRPLAPRMTVWALCCVAALALVAPHARADKGPPNKPPKPMKVEGTITAVDTAGSTVTIQPKKGGTPVVVPVTAATKIEVNDTKPATLADVQAALTAATAAGDVLKGKALVDPSTNQAISLKAEEENDDD